jgi:hypothetical protein
VASDHQEKALIDALKEDPLEVSVQTEHYPELVRFI